MASSSGHDEESTVRAVLRALDFAAQKHRDQRRKGTGAPPFINHAIEVADIVARSARVTDPVTLQAAVLHDTLEDTDTTPPELEREFGPKVRRVVQEVSDDTTRTLAERKQAQIECATGLSRPAKLIRIADKISNILAVAYTPPADWSTARRRDYLEWTERVIAGCRGTSAPLEQLYDQVLREGWAHLERIESDPG